MDFTWDAAKAESNARKHGVAFEEAQTVFADALARVYPDAVHEDRLVLVGMSKPGRLLYVVHIELDGSHIRLISARRATAQERKNYEEGY